MLEIALLCIVATCWLLRWTSKRPDAGKAVVLVVLGSGGHTTEMLYLIKSLEEKSDKIKYVFVAAESDHTSVPRILPTLGLEFPLDSEVMHIRRIRHVGESFFFSLLRIPIVLFEATMLLRKTRPQLVLANGPGTCVPLIWLAWVFGSNTCKLVFVESFCRVKSISLSGRLVYPFVDRFYLQWPPTDGVKRKYPLAKYLGGPLVI